MSTATKQRPPFPPFTKETAIQKIRAAEDAWNSCDPEKVSLAYTVDSRWRNRAEIFNGRSEIVAFLTRKWGRELDSGNWFRSYGNENWQFNEQGLMEVRHASINDLPISESGRKYHWERLKPRPDDHPSLSDLGL
jgi:uncharacterized protein